MFLLKSLLNPTNHYQLILIILNVHTFLDKMLYFHTLYKFLLHS